MKQREVLIGILLIALFSWGGLFLFTYQVRPSGSLTLIAFFFILMLALLCTFIPLTYIFGQRFFFMRRSRSTIGQSLRQSILLTFVIIANLILRLLHSWSFLTAIVIVIAAIVFEILLLARKS